jgi:hypothetical protein
MTTAIKATKATKQQDTTLETLRKQYPASPTLIQYVAQAHADIKALDRRVKELEARDQRMTQFWMRYYEDCDHMAGWD